MAQNVTSCSSETIRVPTARTQKVPEVSSLDRLSIHLQEFQERGPSWLGKSFSAFTTNVMSGVLVKSETATSFRRKTNMVLLMQPIGKRSRKKAILQSRT